MSDSLDTNATAPQGKGMAVTGFVLAVVGLVLATWIGGLTVAAMILGGSAWLMYFWLVLCIVSIILSVMGMSKLKKTGGKRGIGVAGMVVGIVATVYSLIICLGLSAAAAMADGMSSDLENRIEMELNK